MRVAESHNRIPLLLEQMWSLFRKDEMQDRHCLVTFTQALAGVHSSAVKSATRSDENSRVILGSSGRAGARNFHFLGRLIQVIWRHNSGTSLAT